MTDEKLYEVLNLYEDYVAREKYNKELLHLQTMIPKMREFIVDGRREKVMRWLGFMQGVLWAEGYFELEELKRHNMPDGS